MGGEWGQQHSAAGVLGVYMSWIGGWGKGVVIDTSDLYMAGMGDSAGGGDTAEEWDVYMAENVGGWC